jgi:tetratricopeptide (TPR) repeat protein
VVPAPAAPRPAEAPAPVVEPVKETGQAPASTSGPPADPPALPPAGPTAVVSAALVAEKGPPVRASPRDEGSSALRTLLAQAREQRDRGRCEAALDLYGRALAIDGRNAAALAGRGACYLDLSRYAQAEASFEGALESDPRNAEALFGLAETSRYMGKKGDAVAWYERFLAVRPTGDEAAAARRLITQLKE